MIFPISVTRRVSVYTELPADDYAGRFFSEMQKKFQQNGIQAKKQNDHLLSFSGNLFRYTWNGFSFFNGISSGKITMGSKHQNILVSYQLYFLELLVIALIFSSLVFLFTPELSLELRWLEYSFLPNIELNHKALQLIYLSAIWLAFYGVSLLAAYIGMKNTITKISAEINDIHNKIQESGIADKK